MFNPYQFNNLSLLKNLMEGKNPQDVFKYVLENNPQFKNFVERNKDKSIEDIAMEYDIDLEMLKKFL